MIDTYKEAMNIFSPIAKRKGISTNNPHVDFNFENNSIEQGFIQNGTFFVFGTSKKPTKEQFMQELSPYFIGTFIESEGHIGFLGKKR